MHETYSITNRGDRRRWIGGTWIAPGRSETVSMRPMAPALIAAWRPLGVVIDPVDLSRATRLVHEAPETPAAPAEAANPAPNRFDRDLSGQPGGSLPADELREDITAAELADKYERREVSYQTLRRVAARFVKPVPRAAADIVSALRAHGQTDD